MSFSHFTVKNNIATIARHKLSYTIMSTLLVIGAAGCSNNAVDATNNTDIGHPSPTTSTASADSDAAVVAALQANLTASGIEEKIISAVPTDMDGMYWVSAEGLPSFFTDKSGKHIIQGQIIAVGDNLPVDISAALVANTAQKALQAVDKKNMIIYPATGKTKAVVYSFTDADCPYCSKLHDEMTEINALGIEVRYLAWPRSEPSVPKMEAIWCSEDKMTAMDQAKMGATLTAANCDNPVREHMALGMALGVNGTPAIFTESGEQVGGYLPAAELAKAIGIS